MGILFAFTMTLARTGEVRAGEVTMRPGVLRSFDVVVPEKACAGQPCVITVTARDEFGNLKNDYEQTCAGISLTLASGEGPMSLRGISAYQFTDGVARIQVSFTRAETVRIRAQERNGLPEGLSGPLTVTAGPASSFFIATPRDVQALAPFKVEISAVDAFKNIIPSFAVRGAVDLSISTLGPLTPQNLSSESFRDGIASVEVVCERTGTCSLVVASHDPPCQGVSDPFVISPGPVAAFCISVPQQVTAGEGANLAFEARDRAGNVVLDYGKKSSGVSMWADGDHGMKPTSIAPSHFLNGRVESEITLMTSGVTRLHLKDEGAGVEAESAPITVVPSKLDHFEVNAPDLGTAGETFKVAVIAKDAYGNTVDDYSRFGKGIRLVGDGSAEVQPSFVPASRFQAGQGEVEISYGVAETMVIQACEEGGIANGASQPVALCPGPADRFIVTAVPPSEGFRAGLPFAVIVEALDSYGNPARNFAESGMAVTLQSSGTGRLTPETVDARSFQDGLARIQCVYDRAESFHITGVLFGDMLNAAGSPGILDLEKAEPSLGQATQLVGERRYVEARELLNQILASDPDNEAAKEMLRRLEDILRILESNGGTGPT